MEDRDETSQQPADKEDVDAEYSGRLLHQAAIYDNADLTQSLLEGPEKDHIDAQDSFGRTALYTAVTNSSFDCGDLLLQAGGEF
jgi:ankyrin repeat protein